MPLLWEHLLKWQDNFQFKTVSQPSLYLGPSMDDLTDQASFTKALPHSKCCLYNTHDHSFDITLKCKFVTLHICDSFWLKKCILVRYDLKCPRAGLAPKKVTICLCLLFAHRRSQYSAALNSAGLFPEGLVSVEVYCHQPVPRRSRGLCLSSLVIKSWASAGRASSPSGQMMSSGQSTYQWSNQGM